MNNFLLEQNVYSQVASYLDSYGDQSFDQIPKLRLILNWFSRGESLEDGQFFHEETQSPQTFKFNVIYWLMLQSFNVNSCRNAQNNFDRFMNNEPYKAVLLLSESADVFGKIDKYFKAQSLEIKKLLVDSLKELYQHRPNNLIKYLCGYFQSLLPISNPPSLNLIDPLNYLIFRVERLPDVMVSGVIYRYSKGGHPRAAYQDVLGNRVKDIIWDGTDLPGIPKKTPEQAQRLAELQNQIEILNQEKQEIIRRRVESLTNYSNEFTIQANLDSLVRQKQELERDYYSKKCLELRIAHILKLLDAVEAYIISKQDTDPLIEALSELHHHCAQIPSDCSSEAWPSIKLRVQELSNPLQSLLVDKSPIYDRSSLFFKLYVKTCLQLTVSGLLVYSMVQVGLSVSGLLPQVALIAALAAFLLYLLRSVYFQIQRLQFHHAAIAPEPNNSFALSSTP